MTELSNAMLTQEPPLPTLSGAMRAAVYAASYEERGPMGELYAALAKAQGEFPAIETTRQVEYSGRKFWYAELSEILAKTRPVLAANGLCLIQGLHGTGDTRYLTTKIGHSSGAFLALHVALPECDSPQKLGSAMTYLKRYSVSGLLSVASEDDDDGNLGSGTPRQPVQKQAPRDKPPEAPPKPASMTQALKKQILDLSKEAGFTLEELKVFASRQDVNLDNTDEAGGIKVLKALEALKVKR